MGILFDTAKNLISDSAGELAKKMATDKGKHIAIGTGVVATTGIIATGAKMLGKKSSPPPIPQQQTPPPIPQQQTPPPVPQQQTPPPVPQYALSSTPSTLPSVPKASHKADPPAPPIFSFYAIIEDVKRGPYNEIQFKRLVDYGLADGYTLVWNEGMEEWLPAYEVKMMAKIFPQQHRPVAPAMMQMHQQKTFFVNVNNQQVGPFSIQQLSHFAQTGEFTQEMYVWCDGMSQWEEASNVDELSIVFAPQKPPV